MKSQILVTLATCLLFVSCTKKPSSKTLPIKEETAERAKPNEKDAAREAEIRRLGDEKAKLEQEIGQLKKALADKKETTNPETESLQKKLREAEDRIVDLGRKEIELTGMISDKSKHLERLDLQIAAAETIRASILKDVTTSFEALSSTLAPLEADAKSRAATATGARKTALDSLATGITSWRARIIEAGSSVATKPTEAHERLRTLVVEMGTETARWKAETDASEAALGKGLAEAQAQVEKARLDAIGMDASLAQKQREVDDLRVEVTSLRAEAARASEKSSTLEKEVAAQKAEIDKERTARGALEAELKAKGATLAEIDEALAKAHAELAKANAAGGDAAAIAKELAARVEDLEKARTSLTGNLTALESRKRAIDDAIALLGAAIDQQSRVVAKDFTKIDLKPYPYSSFGDWCDNRSKLDDISLITVVAVLEQLGTDDCTKARKFLTHTYNLTLNGKGIVDLRPLSGLWALHTLQLVGNRIHDLRPLQNMSTIKTLFLSDNRIDDITPLASLDSLTWLVLSDNAIESLEGLKPLTSLKELWLTRNRVTNLAPLTGLTTLERLYLSGNKVTELGAIGSLPALSVLAVSRNPISTLAPVSSLATLTTLAAKETAIKATEKVCPTGKKCHF